MPGAGSPDTRSTPTRGSGIVGEGKDCPPLREVLAQIELEGGDPLVHSRFE
jgi:hypothetical protein